jgi:transposase
MMGRCVKLLPAKCVRANVKRNKTDAADACALLEAARCADIDPVRVKSLERQALQGLHRTAVLGAWLWRNRRKSRSRRSSASIAKPTALRSARYRSSRS